MPNTNKELEKIAIEKERWTLAKHKVDMLVGTVKDVLLLAVIVGGTLRNLFTDSAPKMLAEAAAGAGMGGGGRAMHAASAVPHISHQTLITLETVIWVIVIVAVVFYVLPKVQKFFSKKDKPIT